MGSLFKSLTLAAALAASDAQSAAPTQWETPWITDSKAKAVLNALKKVKAETPAGKSTTGIDNLIMLASDGKVTPEDVAAMTSFWSAVHKAGNPVGLDGRPAGPQDQFGLNDELAELARVLAMKEDAETTIPSKPEASANGVEWEGADAQNNNQAPGPDAKPELEKKPIVSSSKKLPPLNETKQQKAEREAFEKMEELLTKIINELNWGWFFDKKRWASTNSKWSDCEIKVKRWTISTVHKNNPKNPMWKSTAFLHLWLAPDRQYEFTISELIWSWVSIKLRDQDGKLTAPIRLNQWSTIVVVPQWFMPEQDIEIVNSAMSPTTTINWITIKDLGPIPVGDVADANK